MEQKYKVRADLPPAPPRIAKLPVDERGFYIPWFVPFINGKPEFRMADAEKWIEAIQKHLCWTCGQPMGRFSSFVLGPMCSITRTTSEPPLHQECAQWTVKGCPFLSKPQMVRREDALTEANKGNVAGEMIERNPGATAIWTTREFKLFSDNKRKPLIRVGEPTEVTWWRLGREATREEVLESVNSGYPILAATCKGDPECLSDLHEARQRAIKYLPK